MLQNKIHLPNLLFKIGDMFYLDLCMRTNFRVSSDIYKFYASQKKNI